METLWQGIRYGARTLAKNTGFIAVAVLTLALGIGADTAISSVVQNFLPHPLPYPHTQQLVEMASTYFPQVHKASLTPGDYFDWRLQNASSSELDSFTAILQRFNLSCEGEPQRAQ